MCQAVKVSQVSLQGRCATSADDAGECVDGQRESFVHVFAQSGIFVLPQLQFGTNGFLDAVSGIETRGDLDAATQTG